MAFIVNLMLDVGIAINLHHIEEASDIDEMLPFMSFGDERPVKEQASILLKLWTRYETSEIAVQAFTEFALTFEDDEKTPTAFLERVCSISQSYWPEAAIQTFEDLAYAMEHITCARFKPLVKLMLDCQAGNIIEANDDAVNGIMHTPLDTSAFYVCVNNNKGVGFEFGDLLRSVLCQRSGDIRCPYSNGPITSLAFMAMPFDVIEQDTWTADISALWPLLQIHVPQPQVIVGQGRLLPEWADFYEPPAAQLQDDDDMDYEEEEELFEYALLVQTT